MIAPREPQRAILGAQLPEKIAPREPQRAILGALLPVKIAPREPQRAILGARSVSPPKLVRWLKTFRLKKKIYIYR